MVGQSVSMVMHWILQINQQSCSSRNVYWHRPGLNVGYMYSWPWIFLRGEITVLCKRSEEEICRNHWILVNFEDQISKLRFRQKSRQNFANKVINRNKILWHDEISCRAGWNFVSLKRSFAFLKRNFVSAKQNIVFVERKFRTRLGRELFNWADMSSSIRVRIVYESWSPFLVSSIKSSVQKTSSLIHRL